MENVLIYEIFLLIITIEMNEKMYTKVENTERVGKIPVCGDALINFLMIKKGI